MWYNSLCHASDFHTGRFCFSKPLNPQTDVYGQTALSLSGLTPWSLAWQQRQSEKGRFALAQRNNPFDETTLTKEWLRQKYTVECLSCPEIGALIDRDGSTVRYWLKKYGIPTRPRGHNTEFLLKGQRKGFHHSDETKRKVGEASRKRGAVPYLKDGKHWLKGKHGEAVPNWKGGVTPERQAFYSSKEWKKASAAVWKRDDAKCQRCGRDYRKVDRGKERFHIHHIIPFAKKEYRCRLSNLVLLCDLCHRWVHSSKNVNKDFIG